MVNLAIKGHSTRGSEVIALLNMLGGKEKDMYRGTEESWVYTINEEGFIEWDFPCDRYAVYSLEKFLEKFPYKVGDKVISPVSHNIHTIESMHWNGNEIYYDTVGEGFNASYTAKYLQPYKEQEETMKEIKIDIPKGYEFTGVDDNNQQVVLTKIQPQYPATYEECCMVLNKRTFLSFDGLSLEEVGLYKPFIKLMRCRNAYWKIAGEQMGLGKPWKPDWEDETEIYYTISYDGVNIKRYNNIDVYSKLAFPTEEMRDAFYDNFKDLIEECKELI